MTRKQPCVGTVPLLAFWCSPSIQSPAAFKLGLLQRTDFFSLFCYPGGERRTRRDNRLKKGMNATVVTNAPLQKKRKKMRVFVFLFHFFTSPHTYGRSASFGWLFSDSTRCRIQATKYPSLVTDRGFHLTPYKSSAAIHRVTRSHGGIRVSEAASTSVCGCAPPPVPLFWGLNHLPEIHHRGARVC